VDDQDQESIRGAQLLLAGTILHQYCTAGEEEDDESEGGVDMIDVKHSTRLAFVFLFIIFPRQQAAVGGVTRLFPVETPDKDKKKKKRKSAVTEESRPEDGDGSLPIDVLVDTIIGFLERGTAFLRTVANQSFAPLSAHLEKSTIELILTVGATTNRRHFPLNVWHSNWNEEIPPKRTKPRTKRWRTKKA
jgi:DNA polymerase phi